MDEKKINNIVWDIFSDYVNKNPLHLSMNQLDSYQIFTELIINSCFISIRHGWRLG